VRVRAVSYYYYFETKKDGDETRSVLEWSKGQARKVIFFLLGVFSVLLLRLAFFVLVDQVVARFDFDDVSLAEVALFGQLAGGAV
jgi:hypothetical protein